MDMILPYYPLVFDGATIPDVYKMLFEIYKQALSEYDAIIIISLQKSRFSRRDTAFFRLPGRLTRTGICGRV